MTIRYEKGQAHHALDKNQLLRLFAGYGHISGGPVQKTADLEVTAPTPWDVLVNGSVVNVDPAANSVTLPAANDTQDRWDLITVDALGGVGVVQGQPGDLVGERGLNARNPAPPPVKTGDEVVIAAAYRRAGEAALLDTLLFDRRFDSTMTLRELTAIAASVGALDVGDIAVTDTATVGSAPTSPTDVVRLLELDALEATVLDHDARHHAGGADEIPAGSLTRQPPTAHATEHSDNGVDPIDAGNLSGASGTDGQLLQTDGTQAFWTTQAGLASSDFAIDTGTFSVGTNNFGFNTATVSFANIYQPNKLVPSVMPRAERQGFNGESPSITARWERFNTDANGDVTGMDITWNATMVDLRSVRWYVMGITV